MAKNIITHIVCYDDHRGFAEAVMKRFSDRARYKVFSFPTREEFIDHLKGKKDFNLCKIAIIGAHDTPEQHEMLNEIAVELKKIDYRTGLIILCPEDKIEDVKKKVVFNVDAYIPKNSNSVLRIHNMVKKLISEYNIEIFRKRRNLSIYVLLTFILLSALLIIIAYLRFPQYF